MDKKVIFCALARDCAKRLKGNYNSFRKLQKAFPQSKWLFIENDSKDGTRIWLDKWAAKDNRVAVVGHDTGEQTVPRDTISRIIPGYSHHRIQRMAVYRNMCLDWIKCNFNSIELDIIVMIDPDVRSIPVSRMIYWIHNLKPDQAITAFGLRWRTSTKIEFHDAYAFRDHSDYTVQTFEKILSRRKLLAEQVGKSKNPILVRSNFNGIGLYPASPMRECRYIALRNDDPEVEADCEHVSLHDQLNKQGINILLDPKLKVFYNSWLSITTKNQRVRLRQWLQSLIKKHF